MIVSIFHLFLVCTNHNPTNNVAENMTNLVRHYGFREETHDISGVKIHCVVKDPIPATDTSTDTSTDDTSTDVFVFIHGTASSSATFFDTMKALPSLNIKCVAIDLPTFGISGHIDTKRYPTNEKLCLAYADVIGHTLHTMHITKQTILVAHSLGGFLSIYVADRFPIKKLVMLNPAGILPTLGEWGYYWGLFFKKGLPTSAFQFSTVSSELLIYLCRWWWKDADHIDHVKTEFWLSFLSNPANEGRQILQRLITFTPFYSYWNTPAILVLMDVYKKVPTSICFGVDDTIIPSHIGSFLGRLTQGEIMIHNIKNASHNPCCNIQCMMEFLTDIYNNDTTFVKPERSWRKVSANMCKKYNNRGYSYPSFEKTQSSFQNVYDYILTQHYESPNQ